MALLSAVIAMQFLFAYVSCMAIFSAKFAVTFGSICSGPLDLVHRTLFGSTFGSVATAFGSAQLLSFVCPIFPQKVQVPPLLLISLLWCPTIFAGLLSRFLSSLIIWC